MTDPTPETGADQGGTLTDDECLRIVQASLSRDRVLGGPDGHDGSPPDVLLTTVASIVAARLADERERIAQAIEAELVCCDGESRHGGGICYWGSRAARIARSGDQS